MSFLDLCLKSCSSKHYINKEVENEKENQILEVGRLAPTAENRHPQRIYLFKSVQARDLLESITHKTYGAPLVLLVCHDVNESWKYQDEATGEIRDYGVMDTYIAGTQMMNMASDIGLTTVWVRDVDAEAIHKAFNLPDHIKVSFMLDIGYTEEAEIGVSDAYTEDIVVKDDCLLETFKQKLKDEGKSQNTRAKYMHDVKAFMNSLTVEIDKLERKDVQEYKQKLTMQYKPSSVNSRIAAINSFLKSSGRNDCCISSVKVQHRPFRTPNEELSKDDYRKLLKAADDAGKVQLKHVMETIANTGIRISELPFVTVESLDQQMFTVSLKGKIRTVLYSCQLCSTLKEYVRKANITQGSIFVTRNGEPLDRSNILHEMKKLAVKADVDPDKVYPHNLRHLFAVTYYENDKDVCHLADILGHSNLNTTRIYTSISYTDHQKMIERMNLLL